LGKIRIGAVSYLNTKPLLYGIVRSKELLEQIELVIDYPSKIANMLVQDSLDVGLIPVAAIPQLKEWHIISDYCIGAEGAVASVCLFSDVPLDKIERVLLDYQSKTSVNLCKVLLKHYWKINPVLENAKEDFREQIQGTTAGVVIGDRALEQRLSSPYIYDLAEAWQQFTGLSFVFAAWIANKKLPESFCTLFNKANAVGLNELDKVVAENPYNVYDLNTYFSKNISYHFTTEKRKGLERFLQLLNEAVVA
jgi:chorismate dehydratase